MIQKLGLFLTLKVEGQFAHMHNVGLSKVTTIEGLHITDLCEAKRAVSFNVQKEMERLRTEGKLILSITSLYETDQLSFKLCYLNTSSLQKHIQDS